MKTLAVLSALVGLAISAPAPPNGIIGLKTSEAIKPFDIKSEIDGPVISARNHLGFASPVIVKKNSGYHVYRDSTEERENADPRENCGKQVRVKLCDDIAKSAVLRRSTENKNNGKHNDEDVEDSIKLAKEAVESLQRDLKTIDGTSGKHGAQWKHGEPDKDLHEDIEAARQALEHAQRNFGNLESMNMRAATIKDSEALHGLGKAKTEEQRFAQWKEAMENIQRNVELARNIEDSFKAAGHDSSFFNSEAIDTTKMMRSNTENNHENKANLHKSTKHTTSLATSGRKAIEENSHKKMMDTKSEQHTISQKKAEEHFGQDMKTAASESLQMKQKQDHIHHNAKMTQGKLADVKVKLPLDVKADADVKLGKDTGIKVDIGLRNAQSENKMWAQDKPLATKMMHSESAHKAINTEMSSRTSENTQHQFTKHTEESIKTGFESHKLQGSDHTNMHHGKAATNEWESKHSDSNSKHEKSAWTETEHIDTLMKSAEHHTALNQEQGKTHELAAKTDSKTSVKSAEHSTELKNSKEDAEQFVKKASLSAHSDMKLADSVELASDINLNGPINVQLNHDANLNADLSKHDNAAAARGLDMQEARVTHGMKKHHHDHGHYGHGHHGHGHGQMHYGHGHHQMQHYGHHGHHGKASDFDSAMHPSTQMEIKEFSEKAAMENMFQWKHHHHDAARSSYGLGGYGAGLNVAVPSGPGAVGVFPQAKVGGCAIPLLLSCSPNVVSGSLAKSHGYAAQAPVPAPAYRHEEESSPKNKRDIIKTKETMIKKTKDVANITTPELENKL